MGFTTVPGGNPAQPIGGHDAATPGQFLQGFVLTKEGTNTPLASHQSRGLVVDIAGSGVSDAQVVAGSGNTAPSTVVQLNGGSSLACKAVVFNTPSGNTSRIAVGSASCDASDLGYRGIAFLEPGTGPVSVAVSNVNVLYLDFLTSGDRISWGVVT